MEQEPWEQHQLQRGLVAFGWIAERPHSRALRLLANQAQPHSKAQQMPPFRLPSRFPWLHRLLCGGTLIGSRAYCTGHLAALRGAGQQRVRC